MNTLTFNKFELLALFGFLCLSGSNGCKSYNKRLSYSFSAGYKVHQQVLSAARISLVHVLDWCVDQTNKTHECLLHAPKYLSARLSQADYEVTIRKKKENVHI